MTCKGPALGIVEAIHRDNGVEVRRRLTHKYKPDAGPRLQNLIARFSQPGDCPETFTGFEQALVIEEGTKCPDPLAGLTTAETVVAPVQVDALVQQKRQGKQCKGKEKMKGKAKENSKANDEKLGATGSTVAGEDTSNVTAGILETRNTDEDNAITQPTGKSRSSRMQWS